MISDDLKEAAKKVKRLEGAKAALADLHAAATNYRLAKNGKADEFVPEDVWEDTLVEVLKRARRYLK